MIQNGAYRNVEISFTIYKVLRGGFRWQNEKENVLSLDFLVFQRCCGVLWLDTISAIFSRDHIKSKLFLFYKSCSVALRVVSKE